MDTMTIIMLIALCVVCTYAASWGISALGTSSKRNRAIAAREKAYLDTIRKARNTLTMLKEELGIVNPQQKMSLSMTACLALYGTLGECEGMVASDGGESLEAVERNAAAQAKADAITLLQKNLDAANDLLTQKEQEFAQLDADAQVGRLVREKFRAIELQDAEVKEIVVKFEDIVIAQRLNSGEEVIEVA